MKKTIIFLFAAVPLFLSAQIVKTAAVPYTKTTGFTPSLSTSSELRVDTTCSCLYWWSRDALAWMRFRPGIDVISGSSAPAYVPRDNQSLFAVNSDSEVYYWDGSTWDLVGGGAPDGNGIYGGSGDVPGGTTATLLGDFDISEPSGAGSFFGQIGTTGGAFWSFAQDSSIIRHFDVAGNNDLVWGAGGLTIRTPATGDRLTISGRDARYLADYSASFSARSLIDKAYGDANYKSIYTGNGTLFAGGANVTFSGSNPLRFHRAGNSGTPIVQKLFSSGTTGFFDRYVINGDSLDWAYALGRFALLTYDAAFTIAPAGELLLAGTSLKYEAGSISEVNEADFLSAETSAGVVEKVAGTSTGQVLVWDDIDEKWELGTVSGGVTEHSDLTGLSDDDHTQYALLAGRSGGQSLTGGTGAGDDLTLNSTTNGTKGDIFIQAGGGNVTVGGGATASEIKLLEPSGSGSNYTAIKAAASVGDVTITLPVVAPATNGQAVVSTTANVWSYSHVVTQEANLSPTIYPAQIAATTNDYSPTGYSTTISQTIQVDGDGSFRTITGLAAATRNGIEKTFENDGTNCYIIAKQHTGSSAANRFNIPKDIVMFPGMSASFRYDSVGAVWKVFATNRDNVVYNNRISTSLADNSGTVTSGDDGMYDFLTNGGTQGLAVGLSTSRPIRALAFGTSSAATAFPLVKTKGTNGVILQDANKTYINVLAKVKVNTSLSTNAESFEVKMGFETGTIDTTLSEGAIINYHHTENSGGWTVKTHDGSTPTTTNAGSAISADTWYTIELIYYPYGEVTAFINGARFTTTSTLPTNIGANIYMMIDKDNGTTARSIDISNFTADCVYVSE